MHVLTSEDWVARLENTETPEGVVLDALKYSLDVDNLVEFNLQLKALLSSDTHKNVLDSTPLEAIPVLLSANTAVTSHPSDVEQTIQLVAQHGIAKEVLLVAEESLDTLLRSTKGQDEEASDDETTPNDDAQPPAVVPVAWKWIRIIEMYISAFPRLVLRKRTATGTAAPIVEHLQKSFSTLSQFVDEESAQGKEVVDSCLRLVHALLGWFDAVRADEGEISKFKVLLREFLLVGIAECLSDNDVAKKHNTFLESLSAVCSDLASSASDEVNATGSKSCSIGEFVLYTSSKVDIKDSTHAQKILKGQLSGVFLCLSVPRWRRTAVNWVTACLSNRFGENEYLEEQIAAELVPPVSSVAATDPNPSTRGTSFRLLTQIILAVHPEVAFGLLRELLGEECPFPNMRASAVALLRKLVVRAFSKTPRSEHDPFAARILLDEYALVLFRSPLLDDHDSGPIDDQEMNRVVECLGLYNVLLGRDKENSTGVRDLEFTEETNAEFMKPLRKLINQLGLDSDDEATRLAIRATEISLERVEHAIAVRK